MSTDPLEFANSFYFFSLSQDECQKVEKRDEMILKDFSYLYKEQGHGSEWTQMLSEYVLGDS